jgi:uncharacterized protein (DUF305 family)
MNRKKALIISSTVLAAALALTGCSGTSNSGSMPGMDMSSSSATSGTFNTQDVTFAQMMLPHHKQAVEMSNMLLAKGGAVDPKVSALATKIKAEQTPEIMTLTLWLKDWNKSTSMSMSGSMGGMMSDGDMNALDKASAADAGKLFLTQMVQHHTGAIDMAQTEISKGKNAAAVKMAKSIVSSQSAEITEMKDMLATM